MNIISSDNIYMCVRIHAKQIKVQLKTTLQIFLLTPEWRQLIRDPTKQNGRPSRPIQCNTHVLLSLYKGLPVILDR